MKKRFLKYSISLKTEYGNLQELFCVEGGCYFYATKNDKHYVLSDFGTLIEFFEDDEDVLSTLKAEYEFESEKECRSFIENLIVDTKNEKRNIKLPEALLSTKH